MGLPWRSRPYLVKKVSFSFLFSLKRQRRVLTPLQNGIGVEASGGAEVDSTLSATAEGTDDDDTGKLAVVCLDGRLDGSLDVLNQSGSTVEGGHSTLGDARVQNLVSPGQQSNGSSSISCPLRQWSVIVLREGKKSTYVAERCNTTAGGVCQKLEIVQGTTALGEAGEGGYPAVLLLEDVLEVNVVVGQISDLVGKLLETEDDVLLGGLLPRSGGDQLCAGSGELFVVVDALGGSFDTDRVAGIKESLGCGGRHCLYG